MHDDLSIAALLGEAPKTPDPGFRVDVFARMSERVQRRAAYARAMLHVAAFTAAGIVLALVQSASVDAGAWMQMLGVAGALLGAGVFALAVIEGPKAALARAGALLRVM
jgi:hypothetical protein